MMLVKYSLVLLLMEYNCVL